MRLKTALVAVMLPLALVGAARSEDCNPNDATLLKPDLVAMPPSRVRVLQRGDIRRIIFATKVANVGKGPLIIQGHTVSNGGQSVTQATQLIKRADGSECGIPAGTFEFHPSHNHFHLNDFSSYELHKDDPLTGPVVAKSDKVSFCITDIEAVRGVDTPRQVIGQCGSQEGIQGISVGWADVYDNYLPDQWIDVPPSVPAGSYFLSNTADPDNFLLEENEGHDSNSGAVSVSLPSLIGATTGEPTPTPTISGPDPTPTPQRSPVMRPPRRPRPEGPPHLPRPPRPPRPTPSRNP